MAQNIKNVSTAVREAIAPTVEGLGYDIWDIEFVKEGASYYLRIYIDCDAGIYIEDCEKVHRAIDPVLDELDPTFGAPYTLNVSSPGLDRPLKTDRDYAKCIGQKVEVKLFAPLKGKKFFELTLKGHDETCVYLEDKGEEVKIEKAKIAKICRAIDLDGLL